jgi:hypothetical protein
MYAHIHTYMIFCTQMLLAGDSKGVLIHSYTHTYIHTYILTYIHTYMIFCTQMLLTGDSKGALKWWDMRFLQTGCEPNPLCVLFLCVLQLSLCLCHIYIHIYIYMCVCVCMLYIQSCKRNFTKRHE